MIEIVITLAYVKIENTDRVYFFDVGVDTAQLNVFGYGFRHSI